MGELAMGRQGQVKRHSAGAIAFALLFMAWSGAVCSLSPRARPLQLAAMVGVWRRFTRGFRVPLHGPAALGAGPAASCFGGSRGAAGASRFAAAVADRALRIPATGSKSRGQADVVSWRKATGLSRSGTAQ